MRKIIYLMALFFIANGCGVLKSGKKMKPRDGVVFYAKEYLVDDAYRVRTGDKGGDTLN